MHVSAECRVGELDAVPDGVGRNAYRIVQEGLTNARKHAHGAAVDVTLDGERRQRARPSRSATGCRSASPRRADPRGRHGPDRAVGAHDAWPAAGSSTGARTRGDFQLRAWLPWPA